MVVKEIRSLTGIRGLAAIYVAVFHFYQFFMESPSKNLSTVRTNVYIKSAFGHGYLAVDLFFILSAFVMTLSSRKLFENQFKLNNYVLFMKKRWIRIYPAYFFIALYGFVVVDHWHRLPNFVLSLTLLNLLFGMSFILGHLWSLGAEWITYLLYPLFLKFAKGARNINWNYCLIALGIIFLFLLGSIHNGKLFPPFSLGVFQGYPCLLKCFGDYIIGIAIYGLFEQNKLYFLSKNLSAVFVVFLILASLFIPVFDLITVFLFAMLIVSIAKDNNHVSSFMGSRFVYFLGEISYPLYLINSLVKYKLPYLKHLVELYFTDNLAVLILFVIFMLLVISISFIFTILIEKPLIKYFTNQLKNNRPFFNLSISSLWLK